MGRGSGRGKAVSDAPRRAGGSDLIPPTGDPSDEAARVEIVLFIEPTRDGQVEVELDALAERMPADLCDIDLAAARSARGHLSVEQLRGLIDEPLVRKVSDALGVPHRRRVRR